MKLGLSDEQQSSTMSHYKNLGRVGTIFFFLAVTPGEQMGVIKKIFSGILWDIVAQLDFMPKDGIEKEKNEENEDI